MSFKLLRNAINIGRTTRNSILFRVPKNVTCGEFIKAREKQVKDIFETLSTLILNNDCTITNRTITFKIKRTNNPIFRGSGHNMYVLKIEIKTHINKFGKEHVQYIVNA